MTAATDNRARVATGPAPAWRSTPYSFLRLVRIELRRSPVPALLPLVGAMFWFDSYRPSTSQAPLWVLRTFWNMGQGHTIIDTGPFVAAMAAWIGSRNGRRHIADLVTATARTPWTARMATWTATAIWAAVLYLACVGAMFAVYAQQGVDGRPPWWWVAVGLTAVVAFSAGGFAIGVFFPSRFAAPVAVFAGFLTMMVASQTGFHFGTGWALVLPTNSSGYQPDSGLFYPYLPDLPIVRIMFLAGILVVIIGLLGLSRTAGGRAGRWAVVIVTSAGMATVGTGIGLATTAKLGPHGIAIAALHDTADDRAIPYTPLCADAAQIPVCLNPTYHRYLTDLTVALTPVFAEIAGLPGAPTRVTQTAAYYAQGHSGSVPEVTVTGTPAVLSITLGDDDVLPGSSGFSSVTTTDSDFIDQIRVQVVDAFIGIGNPAQQAVVAALLNNAGVPFAAQRDAQDAVADPYTPKWDGSADPAAHRFAALTAAQRQTWLTTNLPALRSGTITLEQLP